MQTLMILLNLASKKQTFLKIVLEVYLRLCSEAFALFTSTKSRYPGFLTAYKQTFDSKGRRQRGTCRAHWIR